VQPPITLTDKQKRFAEEYLAELSATRATIRAGYSEGQPDGSTRRGMNRLAVLLR